MILAEDLGVKEKVSTQNASGKAEGSVSDEL